MLFVTVKRRCTQGYCFCAAKERARCIRCDAKPGISHADVGLHVEIVVVVPEIERETGIPHQRRSEAVRPAMLELVDVADVVPIFANVDCPVDGRPVSRFVGCVDLIALELARENLRICPVVISKLEVSIDSQ